tara:strand:- start:7135 stop:9099 length:1965 start_codon:yes stop_codon:yes gene_type:complete
MIELEKSSKWFVDCPGGDEPPKFSVVLLASRGALETIRVLDAVLRSTHDTPIEIIILNKNALDVTALALSTAENLKLLPAKVGASIRFNTAQLPGLIESEYLVFMEDNVVALPGMLDHLRTVLDTADMVGVKILDPFDQNRIVSFGGRFDQLPENRYNSCDSEFGRSRCRNLRYPHFCPTLFAVSRQVFEEVGGFREPYTTLEVAGADLSTRILLAGKKVKIATDAEALLSPDFMRDENAKSCLASEWNVFLSRPGFDRDLKQLCRWIPATPEKASPKVLFVDEVTPEPDRNSGSLDAVNLMRILMNLGYDVLFVPNHNFTYDVKYTEELKSLGVNVLHSPEYVCTLSVLQEFGAELDIIVLSRAPLAARYMGPCRHYAPNAKLVFNTVDLHYLRLQREAELNNDDVIAGEALSMKNFELAAIREADASIVLSIYERDLLHREITDQQLKIHTIPLIRDAPDVLETTAFSDRHGVVFIGTYQHPPNVDAAIFLVREVWPLLRPKLPDKARLYLVGSSLTAEIEALQGNGVEVTGYVEDLHALVSMVRVAVAPLRFGAGLKGKIASSLQAGLPTVATPIAVEGAGLKNGEEILVTEGAEPFADAVANLYHSEDLWNRLSLAGFRYFQREYSLSVNQERIAALVADLECKAGVTSE